MGFDTGTNQYYKVDHVAAVATANADAIYGQPEADLINELKAQVNALRTALIAAKFMDPTP